MVITSGLGVGGAEKQLKILLEGLQKSEFSILVISLSDDNRIEFSDEINVQNIIFSKRRNWLSVPFNFIRLMLVVHDFRPTIILGWMYAGNIFASLAKVVAWQAMLLLGIRASNMDDERYKLQKTLNKWCSKVANGVIFNSKSGADHHQSLGFKMSHAMVIPNAIDTNKFAPLRQFKVECSNLLNVPLQRNVILYPARVDPMKNHELVIAVARRLPDCTFIFIGKGTNLLKAPNNCVLCGEVSQPEKYYNVATITLCFSKFGEGFPNIIGESLACGVPVLANPVGDVQSLLKDTGFLIDSEAPDQIAKELEMILKDDNALKSASVVGRRKISEEYGVAMMLSSYETLFSRSQLALNSIDSEKSR